MKLKQFWHKHAWTFWMICVWILCLIIAGFLAWIMIE